MSDEAREQWGGVAASWEKDLPRVGAAAGARAEEWQLENAELRPGLHLLEVACGTGQTGVEAARRVLPDGRALLSDFAGPMVDSARRRAEAKEIDRAEFAVLDGQALDLPDASFDVVICGFGLMLMPDPLAAVREARRVLKPDGRYVVAVWGEEPKNPWLGAAFRAFMTEIGAPEPAEGTPSPFALGDPARLERVLRDGGFGEVRIEQVELIEPHDSFETWWEAVERSAGPLVAMLAALPEETRGAIRERARAAAASHAADGGRLDFPAAFNGAVAR